MNGVCPSDASGALLPKIRILAAVKGAWSAEAELALHLIPGQSGVRVVAMGRPAPVELGAESVVDLQRPITGLVIEAVPRGDRQGQPLILGQLEQVGHGRHRNHAQPEQPSSHSP
jgi:hypothetical protein